MYILTIKTDQPQAQLGLYSESMGLACCDWEAHRQLAETIHQKLQELSGRQGLTLADVEAIVAYKGPGSFTGLRIGLTVANAVADSLRIPIVGANGKDWIVQGISRLQNGENEIVALPEYGAEPHITQPKH